MEVQEALHLLQLDGTCVAALTADALRKQYLKLALRTHPDKNRGDPQAAERFQQLSAAHALLLESLSFDVDLECEKERLYAILLRALRGKDVDAQLRAMGQYRPPSQFGVSLEVPFDARVQLPAESSSIQQESAEPPDLRQAFKSIFHEEGLTAEGDPLAGYELPLEREH